ncbi:vacuolar alkaline phosphatase [Elasticomyces elasticus]|nr:vacuolar alkaline phosphatase [Elasticomyces elasticus]KAK5011006.1 hypothetical protein LTR28_006379 [Elasticomyces elasticus]
MARGEEPLLVQRPSSEHSSDSQIAEEDALLTGQPSPRNEASSRYRRWREIGLFTWALLATAAVIILATLYQHQQTEGRNDDDNDAGTPLGKRNLIFMVSDGMGPTSLSLTRSFRQYTDHLPYNDTLVLDELLIGQSRTRSSNSLVTDSAAGATAFSCAQKSYNGAISVLPGSFQPCGTVLEAAKRVGYMTGLVVTTRITDATPACFASHVRRREMEDQIALQLVGEGPLGRTVDLMLGGGRCHFLPKGRKGACRVDSTDVVKVAEEKGWNYIGNREGFDGLKLGSAVELPLLGLFADTDIPYEIDRRFDDETYPSLEEMAKTALKALSEATRDSEKGFFLVIEGSRIDHAGHSNDPAAQVHEVLAYDRAVSAVLKFLENDGTTGIMVATSDHETGGLATARQLHPTYPDYLWYPSVLANTTHSGEHIASIYHSHLSSLSSHSHSPTERSSDALRNFLTTLVSRTLGINDTSPQEIESLIEHPAIAEYTFADMTSRRSQIGWSTHGHSAVDVNIYSSDARAASALVGNHENTEIGEFLRRYLGVEDEVEKVTELLREEMDLLSESGELESWLGGVPKEGERLDGQDHLGRYAGDFKHKRHAECDVCGR